MKVLLAAVFFSFSIFSPSLADAQVQTFGLKPSLKIVSDTRLGKNQKKLLSTFRKEKTYFGAMYIVPGEDEGFWFRRFGDLAGVKKAAARACMLRSSNKKTPCTLYALILPKGMPTNATQASGLSLRALRVFNGKYAKSQEKGKFGAFATTIGSDFGYSYGWETQEDAKGAAVEFCKGAVTRSLARLTVQDRKWAQNNGFAKCKIVDVRTR